MTREDLLQELDRMAKSGGFRLKRGRPPYDDSFTVEKASPVVAPRRRTTEPYRGDKWDDWEQKS